MAARVPVLMHAFCLDGVGEGIHASPRSEVRRQRHREQRIRNHLNLATTKLTGIGDSNRDGDSAGDTQWSAVVTVSQHCHAGLDCVCAGRRGEHSSSSS